MEGFGVGLDGHVVVAEGDHAIELAMLALPVPDPSIWTSGSLDAFFALGPTAWSEVDDALRSIDIPFLARRPRQDDRMRLPFTVADYADFYASEHHAAAIGRLLRPGQDPLPAAWKHLPIGYHGRSGTVVVSGTPVRRPSGILGAGVHGPCAKLDVEVEIGFVMGTPDDVFGAVLLNDWSARDIQAFEYQPLGPFLGKSFATSISPWVVPLSRLQSAVGPVQDPTPLPHLRQDEPRNIDVELELRINGHVVSRSNAKHLYWSMDQQRRHLTSNGTRLRAGDLFATGTISGPLPDEAGSLMELAHNGAQPIPFPDGSTRTWLEDGDEVTITGRSGTVSLGAVTGRIEEGA